MPDPEGFYDSPVDATKITLETLLNQTATRTIQYVYDFGDDWDHSIRIERVNKAVPGMTYLRLLKATGSCPPEDVGGAWGYEEFLEALADPDHEQHEDMVQWSGGNFDEENAEIDSIIARFSRLAKSAAVPKTQRRNVSEASARGLRRMVAEMPAQHAHFHHGPPERPAPLRHGRRTATQWSFPSKRFCAAVPPLAISALFQRKPSASRTGD